MSPCWQRSCDVFVHCVPCCYPLTADGASPPLPLSRVQSTWSPVLVPSFCSSLWRWDTYSFHVLTHCNVPIWLSPVMFEIGSHCLCLNACFILIIAMIFQRIWRRIGNWGDSGCARGDGLLPPRLHFCFSFFLSWPLSYQPRSSLILFTFTLDLRDIFYFCNYNLPSFLPSLQTLPYTLLFCFKFMNPILSVISCNYIVYTYLFT